MRTIRLLIVFAAFGLALYSVDPGKPSRTAVLMLQMRALGAGLPEQDLRNPDTLAARFFGARERQVLAEINQPIFTDLGFADAWSKMGVQRRIFLHVLARTRAIDDTVRKALRDGASQVVVLGAGYDSRAYRMRDETRGATVFEVDFPPTQELKKLRVRELMGTPPDNVVFVPIDFAAEELGPVLRKAGYQSDRKTVFIWEGVTYYLTESAVEATLRFVAGSSSPGSTIVFDYESDRAVRGDHDDEALKQAMVRLARWGEPHVFGLPVGNTRPFLERLGLTVASDLGPQELTRLYLTRKDGTRLGDEAWYFGVCVARVPDKSRERP
jgi:methyltransferase (TIGR00027 family)